MFEGVYLLTILYTTDPTQNSQGPYQLKSYTDCLIMGNTLNEFIDQPHIIICTNKNTGEVHAEWNLDITHAR